jgi:hypothetical protein
MPYYLPVYSAGNDGANNNPNATTAGFDKLMTNKTAKNNLVVANAQDANINANGDLISVFINGGSSEGPTDDFRIKPDISGNGTQLFSSYDNSDTAYNTISGTSMAAPNVTGTLLLLQQYYNDVNGNFMRASTLKGLATHTADDAGNVGPDAVYGWGLLNAKAAVEAIDDNGLESLIEENTLQQGETYTFDIISNGTSPLLASITWTDVPGLANIGGVNDATPALINDLDIRVTDPNSTVFFPWRLANNANQNALRNGDNSVDNVERINIDNPIAGTYTITVTHKGTLQDGPQDFSLIVTLSTLLSPFLNAFWLALFANLHGKNTVELGSVPLISKSFINAGVASLTPPMFAKPGTSVHVIDASNGEVPLDMISKV